MKALVIAPQPFFSPRGTPFSVYYRTLITAELGVEIDLLTYGQGQDVDIPGVRIIRIPRFSFLGPVKVGPSGLKFFLDIFLIFWAAGLLIRNRYDFVHAHEEAAFFSTLLKRLFRFKLVYDMHSSLPQQLTNFQFSQSRFLIGAFKRMEDACLKKAEAVVTICPDLQDYANGLIDDPRKHFLIENSMFEDVRLRSGDPNGLSDPSGKKPLSLPAGRRLVVYSGTLEPYQGIELLLQAFSRVSFWRGRGLFTDRGRGRGPGEAVPGNGRPIGVGREIAVDRPGFSKAGQTLRRAGRRPGLPPQPGDQYAA